MTTQPNHSLSPTHMFRRERERIQQISAVKPADRFNLCFDKNVEMVKDRPTHSIYKYICVYIYLYALTHAKPLFILNINIYTFSNSTAFDGVEMRVWLLLRQGKLVDNLLMAPRFVLSVFDLFAVVRIWSFPQTMFWIEVVVIY